MAKYTIYHMDDYAALYEDGKLVAAADDMYHLNQHLYSKLGVKEVFDKDFIDPMSDTAYTSEADIG